jgi:hypothetical protein
MWHPFRITEDRKWQDHAVRAARTRWTDLIDVGCRMSVAPLYLGTSLRKQAAILEASLLGERDLTLQRVDFIV